MKAARVRFYAELNDFLAPDRRARPFDYMFWTEPSVKDLIEGCGVPHTEVDLVLVNGASVGFDHRIGDGDLISVYPMFEAIDITPVLRVRPEPLRVTRFVADAHLGRLARYLRMLGFDVVYRAEATDEELARISQDGSRILLTRDRGLLKRSAVTHGHCVRETSPRRQLADVIRRFDLAGSARPFTRCMRCNGLLEDEDAAAVAGRVPDGVLQRHRRFQRCQVCGHLYWDGTHHQRMRLLIEAVLEG